MANKTVTVRPSGGNYTTLQAAITGEVSANDDLTAAGLDGILTISIEGDWSGGADTQQCSINGFTVDATHYVNIVADTANRAGTSFDATKYRLEAGSNPGTITIYNSYTRITGVQVRDTTGGGQSAVLITNGSTGTVTDSCLAYTNGWDAFCNQGDSGNNNVFVNCIALGSPQRGFHNRAGTNYVYNCIAARCANGITAASGSTFVSINNYSGNNTGSDYEAAGTLTITTSYSEDGTQSTPTAAYSTSTFTNVTNGSEDFTLVAGSALIEAGTDLSADAVFPFDWDITGATRAGTWDVGAYEIKSTGAELAGTVPSESEATGALLASKELSGTVPAVSTATGDILAAKELSSIVQSVSIAEGAIQVSKPLAGTIPAESTVIGAILNEKNLAGTVQTESTVTGSLSGLAEIAGLVSAVSVVSGSIEVIKELSGQVDVESEVTGSITNNQYLAGIVPAVSTASGSLQVLKQLYGTVITISTVIGAIENGIDFDDIPGNFVFTGRTTGNTFTGRTTNTTITARTPNIDMGA